MQSYQVTYKVPTGVQIVNSGSTRNYGPRVTYTNTGLVTKTAYVFADSPAQAAQKAQAQEFFGKTQYDFFLVSVQPFNACGVADTSSANRQNIYLTVPNQVFKPQAITATPTDLGLGTAK